VAITSASDEKTRGTPVQLLTALGHALASWFRERKRRSAAKGRKRGFNRALVALFVVLLALFFYLLNSIFSAPAPGSQLSINRLLSYSSQHEIYSAVFHDQDNRITGTMDTEAIGTPTFYADYSGNAGAESELIKQLVSDGATVQIDKQCG